MRLPVKSLFLGLFLLVAGAVQAATELVPAPPKLQATAWILMDFNSGRVLAEENADNRIEPASLTKLMTAYAVMYEMKNGTVREEDMVRVSEKAWRMKGSLMFIEAGKMVSVHDLMLGMIVQSGNDATVALAEHTAGSEDSFVTLMNRHAEVLGMKNTHFTNATGWPHKDHYTTARDLAILTQAMIRDFPQHYAMYKIKEFEYNGIKQPNRNLLLWQDERVDGVKTGHTETAGYCLISSGVQNNMRLISVVLGTKSEKLRAQLSGKLLNYGFRFYETYRLHAAAEPITKVRVWKGDETELDLGLSDDLFVTTPRGVKQKVVADIKMEPTLIAPINKGQKYGDVEFRLGDSAVATRPLVALKDVPAGGLWRRLVDNVSLWFK